MKILCLFLSLLLVFSFIVSCDKVEDTPEVTTTTVATTTVATTTEATTTAATTTAVTTPLDSRYSFNENVRIKSVSRMIYPLQALSSITGYSPESDSVYTGDYPYNFFSDETIVHLPKIYGRHDNTIIQVFSDYECEIAYIAVYDEDLKLVAVGNDSLKFTENLERKEYYVTFSVKYYSGEYIPSIDGYCDTTYAYAFCFDKR